MRRFEAAHGGRPAGEVITEAINEHGSVTAAARALGIKRDTFYYWVLRLGIRVKQVALPPPAWWNGDEPSERRLAYESALEEVPATELHDEVAT